MKEKDLLNKKLSDLPENAGEVLAKVKKTSSTDSSSSSSELASFSLYSAKKRKISTDFTHSLAVEADIKEPISDIPDSPDNSPNLVSHNRYTRRNSQLFNPSPIFAVIAMKGEFPYHSDRPTTPAGDRPSTPLGKRRLSSESSHTTAIAKNLFDANKLDSNMNISSVLNGIITNSHAHDSSSEASDHKTPNWFRNLKEKRRDSIFDEPQPHLINLTVSYSRHSQIEPDFSLTKSINPGNQKTFLKKHVSKHGSHFAYLGYREGKFYACDKNKNIEWHRPLDGPTPYTYAIVYTKVNDVSKIELRIFSNGGTGHFYMTINPNALEKRMAATRNEYIKAKKVSDPQFELKDSDTKWHEQVNLEGIDLDSVILAGDMVFEKGVLKSISDKSGFAHRKDVDPETLEKIFNLFPHFCDSFKEAYGIKKSNNNNNAVIMDSHQKNEMQDPEASSKKFKL